MYNINVTVQSSNFDITVSFGNTSDQFKLELWLSGQLESGHYDIKNCYNDCKSQIEKFNNDSQIIPDNNSLFRCFSLFIYSNQKFYNIIRHQIIEYVTKHWNIYKALMIGNEYYKNVKENLQYSKFMSNDIEGTNIEIDAFIKIYTPSSILAKRNEEPVCGQLYIYDNSTAIEKRLKKYPHVVEKHIIILTEMLSKNPYAQYYKHLHQLSNIENQLRTKIL